MTKYVISIIKQRKSEIDANKANKEQDLLGLSLEAKDKDDKFTDQELSDLCLTFLGAGHETTSTLLSWVLYALAQHPKIHELAIEEINMFGTTQDHPLPYLTNIIKETLRLYAPVPMVRRNCEKQTTVLGYEIPKGAVITISPYVIHRLSSEWTNPEEFIPTRWLDYKDSSHSFLPFLSGSRNCIGAKFAMLEAKCILSKILPKFKFELSPDHPVSRQMKVTLVPDPALIMNVYNR